MQHVKRSLAALVLLSGLGVSAVSPALAARPHASMDSLVVKITHTGSTVWGKVTLSYDVGTKMFTKRCTTSKCSWKVPAMTHLTLIEKPTNAATWPFEKWTANNGGKMSTKMGKTLKLTIDGMATVKAVYVLK